MRGRQILYPNILPDSNRTRRRRRRPWHAARRVGGSWPVDARVRMSIAYPRPSRDHGYVHRLGQFQGCELRGLA